MILRGCVVPVQVYRDLQTSYSNQKWYFVGMILRSLRDIFKLSNILIDFLRTYALFL